MWKISLWSVVVLCAFLPFTWMRMALACDRERSAAQDPCTISVSPGFADFDCEGGAGEFTIDASTSPCPWHAFPSQSWLTITSTPSGDGDGILSYEVAPAEVFRQGTISVAGKATHVVTQNGPPIECSIRQITHTVQGIDHALSGSVSHGGEWITYSILPSGVYLENLQTSELITLSDGPCYAGRALVDGNGRLVAYESECDPVGQNPDGNREIMLFDRFAFAWTQVTDTTYYDNLNLFISRLGDRIIFLSRNDFTGGNPDHCMQIFMIGTSGGPVSQLTHMQPWAPDYTVSSDGDFIVLASDQDLVGSNSDLNKEIYRLETTSGTLIQITHTIDGFNYAPSVSGDGTRIAFFTTSIDLGNQTGDPSLMAYDNVMGCFLDLPELMGGSGATSTDDTGTRVGVMQADLIGVHDLGNSRSQVLATNNGLNPGGAVQTNGRFVCILSTADLTGDNPDGSNEIFVATCVAPLFADGFNFGGENRWSDMSSGS
jgi:hypothetical protein